MNPLLFMYLLVAGVAIVFFGGYFFARKNEKTRTCYRRIWGGVAIVTLLCLFFFVPIAMTTDTGINGQYLTNVGNVNLVGVPYGENKVANFFALFHLILFLPSAALAVLFFLLPNRWSSFLQRYVLLPNLLLSIVFLSNLQQAYIGDLVISHKSALVVINVALPFVFAAVDVLEKKKEWAFDKNTIIGAMLAFFVILLAFLPMATFAALVPTDCMFLGRIEYSWRAVDFSIAHRYYVYVGIAYYVTLFFLLNRREKAAMKAILLAVCFGSLSSFFTRYGFEGIFDFTKAQPVRVTRLPIHLCHTALLVMPICIGFEMKRLFYFTYFINVYGAVMAIVFPNNGDKQNIFDPDILLFWYNHWTALLMPLICVALDYFKRPKKKQMAFSLGFFALYFVAIMFANGYLSNFVPGYSPNVIGSGTDYLFLNNDYILDILGEEAKKMLEIKWIIKSNDLTLVYYPLYQAISFVGYVVIAYLMWFVYSLFYRIHDSHAELHDQLVLVRRSHLKWKEKIEMEHTQGTNSSGAPELVFQGFCKRYGNSPKLSADHVDLSIHGGEIFGFLGPNGAGKSTCIKSAIGIQPLTEGTIEVCGHDIENDSVEAKRLIGYVPDHYALYEKLTGREYISYFADIYRVSKEDRDARIQDLVTRFELTNAFDARIETYSHGMKQKIAIMAALVHDPKVWILDEPLTGLDPQSVFQVKQTMIAHAAKGNVVFFSSHIIDVVERLCTRIAIIKEGKIVYEGSMEETLQNHPEGLERFYLNVIGELDGKED
ncbi:MAG: YwaF family protein [Bacilli bacterium]|nr:YwaF family protein [Bacilli bacterium]